MMKSERLDGDNVSTSSCVLWPGPENALAGCAIWPAHRLCSAWGLLIEQRVRGSGLLHVRVVMSRMYVMPEYEPPGPRAEGERATTRVTRRLAWRFATKDEELIARRIETKDSVAQLRRRGSFGLRREVDPF